MEIFNKKYVHCMWDDILEGKECFVNDSIFGLMHDVCTNDISQKGKVTRNTNDDDGIFPFINDNLGYRFVYFDPNYETKRAYVAGKKIQFQSFCDGMWYDCNSEPEWADEYKYRVKPALERMSRKQLAEWLARGNGELTWGSKATNCTALEYYSSADNDPVPDDYRVRRWGSDEWIIPSMDVYKEDCYYSPKVHEEIEED